jgi:hypothetical protein
LVLQRRSVIGCGSSSHMCDKCAKLDKKIEHYEIMIVSIGDRVTVDRLMAMVANLRAQKAALHPEQMQ